MICYESGDKTENYKGYRNRTVTKHIDKIKNQLRQIKDCSLKEDDKKALIKKMREMLEQ